MLSGLPRPLDHTRPWWQRLLRNPWTWVVVVLLACYAAAMAQMYFMMSRSIAGEIAAVTREMGSPVDVSRGQLDEAFIGSAKWAALTLAAWVLIFWLLDRLRPTKIVMRVLALGWGAAIATLVSLYINSWMGTLLSVEGPVDNASSARTAIFVAPFVEEAAKATILFLLAMAIRYRIVTPLQSISLAGLSAVGFAFTENIIYYSRTYLYAVSIYGVDPDAARADLVLTRGLATSWGHPLFTSATAIGLAVALRARSKFVRILAPLAGYTFAALGHMGFNGLATIGGSTMNMVFTGGMLLLFLVLWIFRRQKAERALIAVRLQDFVQMGWLEPQDPAVFSRQRTRGRLLLAGLLRGPKVFRDTYGLQRSMTELAYLRSMMTLGTVDSIGDERAAELINLIRFQRIRGLDDPIGLKLKPDTWRLPNWRIINRLRRRRPAALPPTQAPVPALVGSQLAPPPAWPTPSAGSRTAPTAGPLSQPPSRGA